RADGVRHPPAWAAQGDERVEPLPLARQEADQRPLAVADQPDLGEPLVGPEELHPRGGVGDEHFDPHVLLLRPPLSLPPIPPMPRWSLRREAMPRWARARPSVFVASVFRW